MYFYIPMIAVSQFNILNLHQHKSGRLHDEVKGNGQSYEIIKFHFFLGKSKKFVKIVSCLIMQWIEFLAIFIVQHLYQNWPRHLPLVAHAEGRSTAAILFLAHSLNRPIHIAHVARREEVGTSTTLISVVPQRWKWWKYEIMQFKYLLVNGLALWFLRYLSWDFDKFTWFTLEEFTSVWHRLLSISWYSYNYQQDVWQCWSVIPAVMPIMKVKLKYMLLEILLDIYMLMNIYEVSQGIANCCNL